MATVNNPPLPQKPTMLFPYSEGYLGVLFLFWGFGGSFVFVLNYGIFLCVYGAED